MGLTTPKTRSFGNGPVLPPKTRDYNITTLSPIKYLSSDRIMTWSVGRLCSSSRSFPSRSEICDPTNICWVAIENPLILHKICPCFHSHPTNTSRIANQKAGGERVARTAQSMYWSCHDKMRTQILNCRQRSKNRKVETAVRFQPGRKRAGLCPAQETNPPRRSGSGFWLGLEPNWTEPPAKMRTTGGSPGPVANTSHCS